MNLIESLKNLGLNKKEAKVYVSLLQLGEASAYAIANLSTLKKSTTYVILEDLMDKGIVNKIPRVKIMQYTAIPPSELFAMAQAKLLNAQEETLAELKALSSQDENKIKTSYYKGIDELKIMYQKQLKGDDSKKYFGFYGNNKNVPEDFKNLIKKHNIKLKNRGVIKDGIVNNKKIDNIFSSQFNFKENKNYNSSISIEVSDNKTYIFSAENLEGTVIDSSELANALRQIFEMKDKQKKIKDTNNNLRKVLA